MKSPSRDLFEFTDYRSYLQQALPVKGEERGARSRLAEALGTQSAFVSQVLGGLAEFSLEHGMKISRFLNHGKEEREYFMLLLHHGRAGSKDLRDHYEEQLRAIRTKRREVRERVDAKRPELSDADKALYYSSWQYAAVHMCLANPLTQSKKDLAERLGLGQTRVTKILEDLMSMGLARQEGARFIGSYGRLHLPSDSPLIAKHHTNWRTRVLQSLDDPAPQDMHYSVVMSISPKAAEEIRSVLLNAIQSMDPIIKEAKDEQVYVLAMDLFDLKA